MNLLPQVLPGSFSLTTLRSLLKAIAYCCYPPTTQSSPSSEMSTSFQKPASRRQVVCRQRRKAPVRISVGWVKIALFVTFEQVDLASEKAIAFHRFANANRHGAQVFAYHCTPSAMAFERDDAHQVVERIVHIGTLRRTRSHWNPP